MSSGNDFWYFTEIKDGRFKSKMLNDTIRALEAAGGICEVKVRKRRRYRSPQANDYYHVVIRIITNHLCFLGHTGHGGGLITEEEVHLMMRAKFLKVSILLSAETGEYIERIKSTTELTRGEMSDYTEQVKLWAQTAFSTPERPFRVPDPNEQMTAEL